MRLAPIDHVPSHRDYGLDFLPGDRDAGVDRDCHAFVARFDRSNSGNVIIEIGREIPSRDGTGYDKVAHITLTPDDTIALAASLISALSVPDARKVTR